MSTIFTKIINNEIPSYKLYEDDICVAILDAFPFVEGHTLIIPKDPIDYWLEVDSEVYYHIHKVAKLISPAISKATEGSRIGQLVDGRQVPHFHLHLIPLQEDKTLGELINERASNVDFEKIQSAIIENLPK